jgi:hypothetical protein
MQTGSGAHPVSYSISKEAVCSGVNRQGREADHSSPPNAEVKDLRAILSIHLHGIALKLLGTGTTLAFAFTLCV